MTFVRSGALSALAALSLAALFTTATAAADEFTTSSNQPFCDTPENLERYVAALAKGDNRALKRLAKPCFSMEEGASITVLQHVRTPAWEGTVKARVLAGGPSAKGPAEGYTLFGLLKASPAPTRPADQNVSPGPAAAANNAATKPSPSDVSEVVTHGVGTATVVPEYHIAACETDEPVCGRAGQNFPPSPTAGYPGLPAKSPTAAFPDLPAGTHKTAVTPPEQVIASAKKADPTAGTSKAAAVAPAKQAAATSKEQETASPTDQAEDQATASAKKVDIADGVVTSAVGYAGKVILGTILGVVLGFGLILLLVRVKIL